MIRYLSFALLLALVSARLTGKSVESPVFSGNQHITGYVVLPYAELYQSFEFWLSQDGPSRLDWYNALDTTIMRPDIGTYGRDYTISYTTLTVDNSPNRTCVRQSGGAKYPVTAESLIPDLSGFKYQGQAYVRGQQPVYLMDSSNTVNGKENIYQFYYTQDTDDDYAVPVQYSMSGYDTLLGSHYDQYDVYYSTYEASVDSSAFDYYQQFPCAPLSQLVPENEERVRSRPFSGDLLHTTGEHTDGAFLEFQTKHGKQYQSMEHEHRANNAFRHNIRYIHDHNRQARSFKVALNHLADTTRDERRQRCKLPSEDMATSGALEYVRTGPGADLPDYWDWRLHGAVTPVKDQAICGSCWSFGTTGTLEASYFLRTGTLTRLSEQNLVDCSWKQGNLGCGGGLDTSAYRYIQTSYGGLMTDAAYGSYIGQNGKCHFDPSQGVIDIANYTKITSQDADEVKEALVNHGSLSTAIDASLQSFSFYSYGIYDDPQCKSASNELDHQVLIVGYGTLDGQDYWLVKNSWSTYWGNIGYVTFKGGNGVNTCGVITEPTFAILK